MAAIAAAARSISRTSLLRSATKVASTAKSARPTLRSLSPNPTAAARFLRCPVELSSCVETLLPLHSATAAARMTSMLSPVSGDCCGWLPLLRSASVSIS